MPPFILMLTLLENCLILSSAIANQAATLAFADKEKPCVTVVTFRLEIIQSYFNN